MTDREVYAHLYRRYEKPDTSGQIEAWEQRQAEREVAVEAMPLEERKAAFWSMCRGMGCAEAEIVSQWEAYLESGDN